ncbi:Dna-directed rna polymerase subunit beta [Thalictrum thalictroides]|uniref:Dna-directed rna polymerase subunit beta n=1 Tax=Thalictrum thalictroides TaxID=46969 RepID=A0A7J6VKX6_THATH|nr:Dna-directed rna polymerase subunit beta [Thalictrum thalictroides]
MNHSIIETGHATLAPSGLGWTLGGITFDLFLMLTWTSLIVFMLVGWKKKRVQNCDAHFLRLFACHSNCTNLLEKDWSFLESDHLNSPQKSNFIISEAQIDSNSRVLVSIPSEDFVDRLVHSSKCKLLLVVHDSLFVLAGIKEKHDLVKCWQGELIYVPEKWGPFDVVFLCYLPALPFDLHQIFHTIAKRCLPGARLVISFSQGREVVDQQRKEYTDVVVSDLPQKQNLEKVAADNSFEITKFVDEPGFYLAVLKFCGGAC